MTYSQTHKTYKVIIRENKASEINRLHVDVVGAAQSTVERSKGQDPLGSGARRIRLDYVDDDSQRLSSNVATLGVLVEDESHEATALLAVRLRNLLAILT